MSVKRATSHILYCVADIAAHTHLTEKKALEMSYAELAHDDMFLGLAFILLQHEFVIELTWESLNRSKYIKGLKIMATKTTKKSGKSETIGQWNGIAHVAFSGADKENYEKWLGKVDIDATLHDLIASDHKLSLSWDSRSDVFMASMSCYNAESPNFKYTMVSRAPSPIHAMQVALYKHYVVSEENWGAVAENDTWG